MRSTTRNRGPYDTIAQRHGGVPVSASGDVAIERVHFDEGTLFVTFVGGNEEAFEDVPLAYFQSLIGLVAILALCSKLDPVQAADPATGTIYQFPDPDAAARYLRAKGIETGTIYELPPLPASGYRRAKGSR
jgi:hypothetical protein